MKLLLFGGTGLTGEAVLQLCAKDSDLKVTALVRSPSKVSDDLKKSVNVVAGDVLCSDDVARVMPGHDAVISCLGTGPSLDATTLMSDGAKNILQQMRKCGVRKLAVVAISTLLPRQPDLPFFAKVIEDHKRTIDVLKATDDIDWTVLMPPKILGNKSIGFKVANNELPGPPKVSKHDMAQWLISYVKSEEVFSQSVHQLVGISSSFDQDTE